MDSTSLHAQERHFETHHVNDAMALLHATYELRYQVYCIERRFLAPEAYPQKKETDAFDTCSEHFASFDRAGHIAGSVRLVCGEPPLGYPYQSHCPVHEGFQLPPMHESREISRLVVSKRFRLRQEDNIYGMNEAEVPSPPEYANRRGQYPIIVLGLYRSMYAYCRYHGIRYWYAAMERSLARLLNRYGFTFDQIGPEVDYYGPVAVYLADLRNLEARVFRENPLLYEWFCR